MADTLPTPDPQPPAPDLQRRDPIVMAVAVVILIALAGLIAYLLCRVDQFTDQQWLRAIYLLTGVEAVAFAAAGYIFAAQVQRSQLESARQDAKRNESAAVKGELLAEEVQAAAARASFAARAASAESVEAQAFVETTRHTLEDLRETASRLFPESARRFTVREP